MELIHYGTKRHSGRYPWGSGKDPYQRNKDFMDYVHGLEKEGLSTKEISEHLGMSIEEVRNAKSIAKEELHMANLSRALRLQEKGYTNTKIGELMDMPESSVRSLLSSVNDEKKTIISKTADILKKEVSEKGYLDVGIGAELHMGIARTKLKAALQKLRDQEDYTIHYVQIEQLGTGKKTSVMVLAKPGTSYSEVYKNRYDVKGIESYSEDGGRSYLGLEPIKSVSSNRIHIRYDEDGGTDRDGVIEIRRGVPELNLGQNRYAQVRIGVDDSHFLKGMAIYSDDMPEGVDIIYNTNKKRGTPKESVFKEMKADKNNPFGSTVKQKHYIDPKTGKSELSALNIVNEEGDWGGWSRTISSQILSKQSPKLAQKQLGIAYDIKKSEYDEIMSLTNPTVRKTLLQSFADDCDASAVSLKAAALPRQANHVILPFPKMKENEVYAPNYRNGERIVLIRHPHGGIFEIPELVVNNKYPPAKKVIGNSRDAIGISPKVASQLSGADFDGDTVIAIPNDRKHIRTSKPLAQLKDFEPRLAYPYYEGMKVLSEDLKQRKMGEVSNLITDMTIKGASHDEIARAVKHSMVVIDATKHKLNYRQSFEDNGISALQRKYQSETTRGGASTLISRAKSRQMVEQRKVGYSIDPETGEKIFRKTRAQRVDITGKPVVDKEGKVMMKLEKSTKMAETKDAYSLSSGTEIESIYADHANRLKELGNQARKDILSTPNLVYSPQAKKIYEAEVSSLTSKLNMAKKNAPLEREAQRKANIFVKENKKRLEELENRELTSEEVKKMKGQALTEARSRVGAHKERVSITPKEWEAIQAGAISNNTLADILKNTDLDIIKQYATPRTSIGMTPAKINKAKAMLDRGYTQAEVADVLRVSTSTLFNAVSS